MLKHIVLFKFKPEATPAQKQAMIDGLNGLPALIPEIKAWQLVNSVPGRPARFYHVGLFSEFADVAALDRYIAHPAHQRVVALIEAACESRAGFDYA